MVNRLADESSPYLRQHRDNPVDWMPWGDDAFARARADDKPIFLSVGYSSCHWCHVMAHESFEDADTAAEMNRRFVNVKVDREERPDVDAVYMQAVQAMTGRGGWPMSVWLTPDGRPFYGGTYFPDTDRHGMPSFRTVMAAVSDAWNERRDEVLAAADRLTAAIDDGDLRAAASGPLERGLLDDAVARLRAQYEPRLGGFGRAPKFPPAMTLAFLARSYVRDADPHTLTMITHTLDRMAAGGIHDQLGGGFARYSTDDAWLVPHFEKMLYDNALLLRAYLYGYVLTRDERYRRVVEQIVEYLVRDLRHPDGGFFSAEDADSEGEEGRFYVWSLDEIREVCGPDADAAIAYWGVTAEGNFEGRNILFVVDPHAAVPDAVERARVALREHRERRIRPGLDDKVLLAWNALLVASLAEAAAALDRPDWLDIARTTTEFLVRELRRDDGRLLRSWQADAPRDPRTGRARHLAYAEDHAALLEALVTMAETDEPRWLADARVVADALLDLFHDDEAGGFFTTGHDAPPLVVRAKDVQDNATPAATSLAAVGLLRLAALTGEERYERPARRATEGLARVAAEYPSAFAYLLDAIERLVVTPIEVAIVGTPDDPMAAELRAEVFGRLLPASVRLSASAGTAVSSPLLEGRGAAGGAPTAYVCERYACGLPATDVDTLARQLDAALAARR
ncbi:MAG TPA: thioredoxin domain-containing protein [Acidimicrobiia bacterium]|nr:thioredoxin domain-containing protein [Acidimicrobiia bacterium]